MSERNAKIVAFVGLAGSGKSLAVSYFTDKGLPKVYFGGVILDAMEKEGLDHTEENERQFREDFRKKNGKDAVAKVIIEQINNLIGAGQRKIIADDLCTWTEYKALKSAFPGELVLVAIVAPRHLRYRRLAKREIRPLTATQAYERDQSEIENLEKGGPIAISDHFVINDGSEDDFFDRLDELLKELDLEI